MSNLKSTPADQRQHLWDSLEELDKKGDLGMVRQDLLRMYEHSLLSEDLGGPQDRHSIFTSFKHLYNFLTLAEMYRDPSAVGVNLLCYGE